MNKGYALRQVRQSHGYSQSKIAEMLDTTQQQYSKYENGIQDPSARVIIALAEIYGVTTDELLGLSVKDEN